MRSKTAVILLASVFGPLLPSQPASAQDDHPGSSPLGVTAQFASVSGDDCKAGEGLVVQLHYTGVQPLRAYLIRLIFSESQSGKGVMEQSLQEVRDLHEPAIAAGEEWTRTVCTVPKKIAEGRETVNAEVDVLKFADGSTWGPLTLRESHQLVGTVDGMDFAGKTSELAGYVTPILPQQGPVPTEHIESLTMGPLRIESGIWRDERGKEMLAIQVTNENETPIRGYLFTTTFFDPNTGDRIRRFSTKELETHGNPEDYLAPGSSWIADPRKFSYLPDGTPASYKINLDLVVFADGSTFGPKKSQESDEVLGILQGIDDAKRITQETSTNKPR